MFRIGEFSKLAQVSVRMLRYYDEMGLLRPAAIDEWTGYRMYSASQIPVLNKIIYLRDSGFNVSEIAAALQSENDNVIVAQLDKKYKEILRNIQLEEAKLRKIEAAKEELEHGNSEINYNVTIKAVPSYYVLSLRRVIPDYYGEGALWREMSAFAQANQIDISGDTFSIYHDEDYREENVDVELCAIAKKAGKDSGGFTFRHTEAVPQMACTMVYGDFSHIAEGYLSFARWLQERNQYEMGRTSRQIVHRGPWNEANPENYLTEIQIPLLTLT
ncbi:MerR family transcriptional regulator [Bariatricus massiliensis]|uniref:MerR family transcriptional regulator n=1 Tax=Bariatricus massiliensis TaxID=1745713 RepID=A0ABS8DKT6_9FIRM|nr:MerR family transcriptional regulator [Bariatricus massiliensis]MCB7305927.1 MerR family transcriptional regulator [Bariatricus massiliensis]MCB7376483.1 MerR family transcriptional regulator [Bariatricus massiliensis]MCB7389070.1 MerR family transcriptional regulator [Bariatricus massiliensis]MCB7413243.1 MerR family transcriptional regulator [Bariatricus massiliensis]MCQ5255140.1 MerR family transcriptional regulator [Bariatricus massiliensis]